MTDELSRTQASDDAEVASDHKEDEVDPVSNASFSVSTKRIRKKILTESPETARAVPFDLAANRISSTEVTPVSVRALNGDKWQLEPHTIDLLADFELTKLDPPRIRVWENAKLESIEIDMQSILQPEIGLPPRPLLSMTDFNESNLSTEPDTKSPVEASNQKPDSHISKPTEESNSEPSHTAGSENDEQQSGIAADQLMELDEFLFDIEGGSIDSHDPLCIVAAKTPDEKYKQTLETLCQEEFRQLNGGKPLATLLADSEGNKLENTRVQNRIVSYDDDSNEEYFKFVSEIGDGEIRTALREGELNLSKLTSRIDEFFSETLGYLLLFADEQYMSALYDYLTSTDDVRETTQILSAQPRQIPEDVKRELVQLAWGKIKLGSQPEKLDRLFHSGADTFKDSIQPHGALEEITARDNGKESRLHYWVKCFIVEVLLKKDGISVQAESRIDLKERIPTETELQGGSNPRPDIYHEPSGEVYEIETLYGTDHKKITRTIDKYEGVNVKRVNVVLPNLTCLRNLSDILRKTQKNPGEMFHNKVKFWTLDTGKRDILPIEDVVARLADMQERSEKLW
jgi:hypothetical protein